MSVDALGNILKQHLLHPNSSHILPKKRKISEPTFPSSSLNNHSMFAKQLEASLKANELEELNQTGDTTDKTVYFSNFGLETQGQNVARKISVLHPANRPYFMRIKQPVFDHQPLIDLRQIPGLPAQLNNELFHKNESNLLKSDHHNSVTNLTNLDQLQTKSTYVTQSAISQPSIMAIASNRNSNSSHKYIDKPKNYMLISEYLSHYDRKITVKGQLKFDVLARTLEEQGEQAEFRQSDESDCCAAINKFVINNQVKQISSMPVFTEQKVQSNKNESTGEIDLTDEANDGSEVSKQSDEQSNSRAMKNEENSLLNIDEDRKDESTIRPADEASACVAKRPANLFSCLPKKPCQLTCSNLVSPETPRSEKTFVQCNLNGKLYTYLSPKRTTRVTFCCIYRPIPFFVEQSIDPKLSMYSNWQVLPAYESILNEHKAPVLMRSYDSRQWKHRLYHYTSKFTVKLPPMIKVIELVEINESSIAADKCETKDESGGEKTEPNDKRSLTDEYLDRLKQIEDRNGCTMLPAFSWMMRRLKQDRINIRFKLREFKKKFCEVSVSELNRIHCLTECS